jgi:hypothetical protein
MTASRDPDRLIRAFLLEGDEQLADQVYDAVRSEIEMKRQRASIGSWRTPVMNRFVTIGLAAAVVLAVVIIGSQFLGSRTNVGTGGDATPTPHLTSTPEPTATPSPVTELPSWYSSSEANGAGILAAGSHATQRFSPTFTFSVPDGWVNDTDSASYFGLFADTPVNQAQFARSETLAHSIAIGWVPTPYFTCESLENNRGATAAEMVAAARANEVLDVSEPVDVSIGGLTGTQVDVRRNPDWTGTCPEDSGLPAGVDPENERARVVLLDVPGRGVLVVIVYSVSSAEHEAFLGEAMPIIESFQFTQ